MDDWQTTRLTDAELKAFFDRLFPHGFAGDDVLEETAPDGWEKFVIIREAISLGTGIACSELPFAGELMEVNNQFRDWTGAIERLLHQFGVSLLVSEHHYVSVAKFINEHNDASGDRSLNR